MGAKACGGAPGRRHWIGKAHCRPGLGGLRRVGSDDAEETDLDLAEAPDLSPLRAPERSASRALAHIVGQPGELGFGNALMESIRPEVEFVISGNGQIEFQRVPGGDHLLTPKCVRGHGWR